MVTIGCTFLQCNPTATDSNDGIGDGGRKTGNTGVTVSPGRSGGSGGGGSVNNAVQGGNGTGSGSSHSSGGSTSNSTTTPYTNYDNNPLSNAQLYKNYLAAGGASNNADMDLGTGYSGQDAVGCNGGDQYSDGQNCSNYHAPFTIINALQHVTIGVQGCIIFACASLTTEDGAFTIAWDFNQFWAPRTTKVVNGAGVVSYVSKSGLDYAKQFIDWGTSVGFNNELPSQQSSESVSACACDVVGGCVGGMAGAGGNFGASVGGGVGVSVMGGQSHTFGPWW